jgi:septal ring-binding cell division protein DamX
LTPEETVGGGTEPAVEAAVAAEASPPVAVEPEKAEVPDVPEDTEVPVDVTPEPVEKAAVSPSTPEKAPPPAMLVRKEADYEKALSYFQEGELAEAAGLWKSMLQAEDAGSRTLQVIAACQEDTVKSNFQAFSKYGKVFAVPFRFKGNDCYRVCLGVYPGERAARNALSQLPVTEQTKKMLIKKVSSLLR